MLVLSQLEPCWPPLVAVDFAFFYDVIEILTSTGSLDLRLPPVLSYCERELVVAFPLESSPEWEFAVAPT